jgi:hypothetical protein
LSQQGTATAEDVSSQWRAPISSTTIRLQFPFTSGKSNVSRRPSPGETAAYTEFGFDEKSLPDHNIFTSANRYAPGILLKPAQTSVSDNSFTPANPDDRGNPVFPCESLPPRQPVQSRHPIHSCESPEPCQSI